MSTLPSPVEGTRVFVAYTGDPLSGNPQPTKYGYAVFIAPRRVRFEEDGFETCVSSHEIYLSLDAYTARVQTSVASLERQKLRVEHDIELHQAHIADIVSRFKED